MGPESVKGKIRITFAIALTSLSFLLFKNEVFHVFYDHRVSSCPPSNRVSSGLLKSYPAKHAHLFPNERQRGGNGGKWHENAWNDKRNNQIVPGSRFYPRLPLWLVLWPVYTF